MATMALSVIAKPPGPLPDVEIPATLYNTHSPASHAAMTATKAPSSTNLRAPLDISALLNPNQCRARVAITRLLRCPYEDQPRAAGLGLAAGTLTGTVRFSV